MKTINARGKVCPEPVIMTKAVVDRGEKEVEVLLDNPTSATNVRRFLESRGYSVLLKDDEGMLTLSAHKKETGTPEISQPQTAPKTSSESASSPVPLPPSNQTFSVLITCSTLGRGDAQLGEVLIKSFLGTLAQIDTPPTAVALMNEGVKLSLYDSSTCDHLKNLEKKGTTILVCGTCVNHFNIGDKIGAGTVSNMFEILEVLNKADKIITL
ncbi:MAG: sulfurtransferase-like selenium metabolism protein YedF [Synergistaceae bacterium]|jgi:selenium metabolism protein YedF|nr:sulfurtransferase-like selenium metabolism protein YedF [Synergistaceae bacterium]